jgi:hypothetical protein
MAQSDSTIHPENLRRGLAAVQVQFSRQASHWISLEGPTTEKA